MHRARSEEGVRLSAARCGWGESRRCCSVAADQDGRRRDLSSVFRHGAPAPHIRAAADQRGGRRDQSSVFRHGGRRPAIHDLLIFFTATNALEKRIGQSSQSGLTSRIRRIFQALGQPLMFVSRRMALTMSSCRSSTPAGEDGGAW